MQGAFDFYHDLAPRPRRPERLFFGLFPDAETAGLIATFRQQFRRDNGLPGKPLRPDRLHVSLRHLGDYARLPGTVVYAARAAGKAVAARACPVTFRCIGSFAPPPSRGERARRSPLVLLGDGAAFDALQGALGAALAMNGLPAGERFTPHMTLSYGPRQIAVRPIAPIRFLARELVLVHSELWRTRYNVLGRWPLRD
jgi:2'-5' RNA ligase